MEVAVERREGERCGTGVEKECIDEGAVLWLTISHPNNH